MTSILLLFACASATQASIPPADSVWPALDRYVVRVLGDWQLPGIAVAVVRNDSVLVAKGYGNRTLGRNEPVDEHTVFDAASLTKSFTAAAIATLVDQGVMRWDDPVRRYLPELEFPDPYLTANLTIRDLLTHRTGLEAANFMWRFTGIDRAEVLRRVRFLKADAPFRAGWIYSNVGYTIAGEAAARAAKTSWDQLIRTRLLDPLGMHDTYLWSEQATRRGANVASPHAVIDQVQQPIDPRDGLDGRDGRISTAPAGAVQSSVTDLAIWLRFHLANGTVAGRQLVSARAMEEMHSPQITVSSQPVFRAARQIEYFPAYGMGWQVWDYRGRTMLWHTGSGNGQLAYMAILPKQNLGVVVLVNSWRGPIVHATIVNRMLDAYLGLPSKDYSTEALRADSVAQARAREAMMQVGRNRASGTRPSRPLESYVGTYVDSLYGAITVAQAGGSLTLQMGQGEIADLSHWQYDSFQVRWRTPLFRENYTTQVAFALDPDGTPTGLSLRLNRDLVRATRTSTQ
jgi:CubicO group peptidase (beta-lactamase class C family)